MTMSTLGLGPKSTSSEPLLSFDDLGRLRILPSHVFEEAEKTRDESQNFVRDTHAFHDKIASLLQSLTQKAASIQSAQREALGAKSRVESEVERRKAQQAQIKGLLCERQAELSRLNRQLDSLMKVSHDQVAFIDRLSSQ